MIRQRTLTAIAAAALLALPLAACTDSGAEEDPTTTQDAPPTADPSDATPQERITASFEASDAAAANGWKDTSYVNDFFVPELAEKQRADDEERASSGAVITGDRALSDWTTVEETDTTAVVEFCDDTSALEATKDGEPVEITNQRGESVGRFTLVKESDSEPWMIKEQGYYDEGTTCDAHFAG
ncbi:hypothetical protein [Brachybacterium sp. sponge]|uniref:hypothetical protein n=1 Tax=Brachybacterium sp. sponge TaxID=1775432 RepID=UPI0007A4EB24|nr:hypothetical protein [Brachybacterium sp. sponge]